MWQCGVWAHESLCDGFLFYPVSYEVSNSSYLCFSCWILDCERCKMIFPQAIYLFIYLTYSAILFSETRREGWCGWFYMQLHWSLKRSSLWPTIPGHPLTLFFRNGSIIGIFNLKFIVWPRFWYIYDHHDQLSHGVQALGKYLCGSLKSWGSWWWGVGFWNTRAMEGKLMLPPGWAELQLATALLLRLKNLLQLESHILVQT